MRGSFQAVLSLLFVSTSCLLADLNNELIPLTLKQMARSDRLPESAEEATLLTESVSFPVAAHLRFVGSGLAHNRIF